MTRALVTMIALTAVGCATGQPSQPAAPAAASAPASPTQPAPAPAPQPPPAPAQAPPAPPRPPAVAPAGPPPSPAPRPAPAPVTPAPAPAAPAPAPAAAPAQKILYVRTHLANFRASAGTTAKILRVLRRGARLEVLETRNDWLRVRLDDAQEGWVAESVASTTAP
jgi:uncharacterized protein YgiM (DUF1202 family)